VAWAHARAPAPTAAYLLTPVSGPGSSQTIRRYRPGVLHRWSGWLHWHPLIGLRWHPLIGLRWTL